MNKQIIVVLLILGSAVWGDSCGYCGVECESSCGTKHFKSCCYNYLKKRSNPTENLPIVMDMYNPRMHKLLIPSLRKLNFDDLQEFQD